MRPNGESPKPSSPKDLNLVFMEWREKDQQSELEESVAVSFYMLYKYTFIVLCHILITMPP